MLNVNLVETTLLCMQPTRRPNGSNNQEEVAEVGSQTGRMTKKILWRSGGHKQ